MPAVLERESMVLIDLLSQVCPDIRLSVPGYRITFPGDL